VDCTPILDIPVVYDLYTEHKAKLFIKTGYTSEDVVIVKSAPMALRALKSGNR
jgi:hypothetical protein